MILKRLRKNETKFCTGHVVACQRCCSVGKGVGRGVTGEIPVVQMLCGVKIFALLFEMRGRLADDKILLVLKKLLANAVPNVRLCSSWRHMALLSIYPIRHIF